MDNIHDSRYDVMTEKIIDKALRQDVALRNLVDAGKYAVRQLALLNEHADKYPTEVIQLAKDFLLIELTDRIVSEYSTAFHDN